MNNRPSTIKRLAVYATIACMIAEPAFGAVTDISNVPLSSGTVSVVPNVMFILDDSGSMERRFLPDYVHSDGNGTASRASLMRTDGSQTCQEGEPCYYSGGANGFNGIYYDVNTNYKPGVNYNAATMQPATLSTTSLEPDAYLGGTNVNLTNNTVSIDKVYCNGLDVCKRNGADNSGVILASGGLDFDTKNDGTSFTMAAGQFPYRAHRSNGSTHRFGVPEMLPVGSFSRSGTTVTVNTTNAPGVAVGDRIHVAGTATTGMDRVWVAVASVGATSFTYTSTVSGTVAARDGGIL